MRRLSPAFFLLLLATRASCAVTTFDSRVSFEAETFTITSVEDFSSSTLNTIIGDTPANQFVSGVITISSNVQTAGGSYRAGIKGTTHPDRANDSQFAALESFGSNSASTDLQGETATIFLSGTNHVFGMDLGSFAEQTTAYFRTNLGNSYTFTGTGSIGTNRFAGVISDQFGEYFTQIDFIITGPTTSSDGFGIDNLIAGTIPEPHSALIFPMLPALALLRRKRS